MKLIGAVTKALAKFAGIYAAVGIAGLAAAYHIAPPMEYCKPAQCEAPNPSKRAILAMAGNEFYDDITVVKDVLESRGYSCEILEKPSQDSMLSCLEKAALESDSLSQTIFYFSGHGIEHQKKHYLSLYDVKLYSKRSLESCIGGFFDLTSLIDGRFEKIRLDTLSLGLKFDLPDSAKARVSDKKSITPDELLASVAMIKGKKAIILGACFSGAFVDASKGNLENYVILAVCPARATTQCCSYYMKSMSIDPLTLGIYRLGLSQEPINLSEADIPRGNPVDLSWKAFTFPLKIMGIYNPDYDQIQRTSDTDFWL